MVSTVPRRPRRDVQVLLGEGEVEGGDGGVRGGDDGAWLFPLLVWLFFFYI